MYFISSWICNKSSKNMFVKIVHQGGRVEIHDRPIQAAELLSRNPRCCVAHHDVYDHPYAVVSPSTTLALGQKYYIVPMHTITTLQLKYSQSSQSNDHTQRKNNGEKVWLEKREADCRRERGTRLSPAHVDQWQPGLESIKE